MRKEMTDWLIKQIQEEIDTHGGEVILFTMPEDAEEGRTFAVAKQITLVSALESLINVLDEEVLMDYLLNKARIMGGGEKDD